MAGKGCPVGIEMLEWETFTDRDAESLGHVDYLLGADVVYDPALVPPLANTIEVFCE
jgi:hypothetical protein